VDGFNKCVVYASDTDSIYVEKKHADKLMNNKELYGSNLG